MKFIIKFIAILFLLTVSLPNSAEAGKIQCDTPQNFVQSMNDTVTSTVLNEKFSEEGKTKFLAGIFRDYVDIQWIGKFVIGRNWRSLEKKQQDEYLEAYEDYLIARYVPIFKDYRGEKVEFVSSTPLKRKNEFLVATKVIAEGEPEIGVTYRVKKGDKCFMVYDIVAEGVSMLNTQRQDFSSIYSRKGFEELMSILRNKAAEIDIADKK